jgi:LPS-assembly lipoprotein
MRRAKLSLLLVAACLLAACGFQLRGSYVLPFATLHMTMATTSELYASLKRTIETSSATRVVADPQQAEAVLTVLEDRVDKSILSLNSSGRVREYQLTRSFSFRLSNNQNADFIPPSQVTIRRELTFSDDKVLSKESEEALIWREMQSDLVQQVMRRLTAAKLKAAE